MRKLIDAIKKSSTGVAQKDSPSEIKNTYLFDDDFIGFTGHFQGYPILPAVLQLLVARLLIEDQKGPINHRRPRHKTLITRFNWPRTLSQTPMAIR